MRRDGGGGDGLRRKGGKIDAGIRGRGTREGGERGMEGTKKPKDLPPLGRYFGYRKL